MELTGCGFAFELTVPACSIASFTTYSNSPCPPTSDTVLLPCIGGYPLGVIVFEELFVVYLRVNRNAQILIFLALNREGKDGDMCGACQHGYSHPTQETSGKTACM